MKSFHDKVIAIESNSKVLLRIIATIYPFLYFGPFESGRHGTLDILEKLFSN